MITTAAFFILLGGSIALAVVFVIAMKGAAEMLAIERDRTDRAEARVRELEAAGVGTDPLPFASVETPLHDRYRRIHDEFQHDLAEIRRLPEGGAS